MEGDNREEYARLHMGQTLIQIREKQYHNLLVKYGMQRLGLETTEINILGTIDFFLEFLQPP